MKKMINKFCPRVFFHFMLLSSYICCNGLSTCQESEPDEVVTMSEQCSENQVTIDAVKTCIENLDQCLSQQVRVDTDSTRCITEPILQDCTNERKGKQKTLRPGNGYRYSLIRYSSTWNKAANHCTSQDAGHLAAVGIRNCTSAREIFRKLCLQENERVWIGLRKSGDGEWEWNDGVKVDRVTLRSKTKKEERTDNDKCASIQPSKMLIHEESCSDAKLAICEKKLSL